MDMFVISEGKTGVDGTKDSSPKTGTNGFAFTGLKQEPPEKYEEEFTLKVSGNEEELKAVFCIHQELYNKRKGSEEIIAAFRRLATLESLDVYEQLIWYLMEVVVTYGKHNLFDGDPDTRPAREAMIAALDQFVSAETEPVFTLDPKGCQYMNMSPVEITEEIIDVLVSQGCWTQALAFSRYLSEESYSKVLSQYASISPQDPYIILMLINEGLIKKLMQLNPEIEYYWPTYISFLLRNCRMVDRHNLTQFFAELSGILKRKVGWTARLFLDLLCGIPFENFDPVYKNVGHNLRTYLLLQLVSQFWNRIANGKEYMKERLLELLYYKTKYFFDAGYKTEARETLQEINNLNALRQEYKICPLLIDLAKKVRGESLGMIPMEEQKAENKRGFFDILTSTISDLIPKQLSKAPERAPPPPKPKNFYFDSERNTWIIDGQVADNEYDMGEEPQEPRVTEVPLPPSVDMAQIEHPLPEPEPAMLPLEATSPVKDPFTQIKVSGISKKRPNVRNLYVAPD